MNVALIGYSQSGRSTLYRAASRGLAKGEVTAVPVPDPRFEAIVAQVKPKKQTPATVVFYDDLDAVSPTGRAFSQRLVDQAKKADLLLHVVRAFESPVAPFHAEIDPKRDRDAVEIELVLADLQIVENRLERLKRSTALKTPGSTDYLENQLFGRLRPALEEGTAIRDMELAEDDLAIVRNYQFLSAKPMVTVYNVGERGEASDPGVYSVCATLEEEIAQLDAADQPEFLASMGLDEPASARMIRAVYDALGLITFFTAGENETRAWPLRRGANALKAAGTIHNDIAKGFIRAEIVHYADYAAAGSLDAAYSGGKMTLQGKEYLVQDGDLLHIRNKS